MDLKSLLSGVQRAMEGSEVSAAYAARHGIQSQSVLTVTDDEMAGLLAEHLAPRIAGKTVVEIGGGIGLLALHMGFYANRVFCIEANPMWATSFTACLLSVKPKNVSYLFGSADEFQGLIKADVALFCTHSGVEAMKAAGLLFAPEVIDVYGEIIAASPTSFNKLATSLRPTA